MNPMQLIQQMFSKGNNPQQIVTGMMKMMGGNNPMISNLISIAQAGNNGDVEAFARNMFNERGRDFDKEFGEFMSNFKTSN